MGRIKPISKPRGLWMKKILTLALLLVMTIFAFAVTVNYNATVVGDYSSAATVFSVTNNGLPVSSGVTVWLYDSTQFYSPQVDQYAEACSLVGSSANSVTVVRPSNADFIGGTNHTYLLQEQIVNPTSTPTQTTTFTQTQTTTFTPTFTPTFTQTQTTTFTPSVTPTPGLSTSGPLSIGGATSLVGNQFINGIETTLLPYSNYIFRSPVLSQTLTTFNPASGTAYFVYIGDVMSAFTPKYVRLYDSTTGTESSVEVGIFTSINPPNAAGQTLTKLVSGTVTTNLATGIDKNASPFATVTTVGQHLWVGTLMTWTVQPVVSGLCNDFGNGSYLTTSGAGVFSSGTTYTGAFSSTMSALTGVCPDLVMTNN